MGSDVCCLQMFKPWHPGKSGMRWLLVPAPTQQMEPLAAGSRLFERQWACPSRTTCWCALEVSSNPAPWVCQPQAAVLYCGGRTHFLVTGTSMLKAKKIRLQVNEQDAATLEMMRGPSVAASTTGG